MYKKGIKAAESILKKFPNHGETLAMKGLITSMMGKRDEVSVPLLSAPVFLIRGAAQLWCS